MLGDAILPNDEDLVLSVAAKRVEASRMSAEGQIQALYRRYEATRRALEALQPTAALATQAVAFAARAYGHAAS